MIVVRLMLVALVIAVLGLALTWLVTGERKYLVYLGRVLRFSVVVGFIVALLFVVERIVLR